MYRGGNEWCVWFPRHSREQNSRLAKEKKVSGGDWKEILPESLNHNLSSLCPSILRPKNHRCFHFLSFQRSFTRFFFSDKFLFRASVALHLPADWEFSKLGRPLCREFWTIIFRSCSMTFQNLFAMLFMIYYPQYFQNTFHDLRTV